MNDIDSPFIVKTTDKLSIDISVASKRQNRTVLTTLKELGFSLDATRDGSCENINAIGNVLFRSSPKRLSGYLNISVIGNAYLPSTHDKSNAIIRRGANLKKELIGVVKTHALDALRNDLCRRKVTDGSIQVITRINPSDCKSNLLSRVLLDAAERTSAFASSANPQDLKHQVAFFLSTFDTNELLDNPAEIIVKSNGEFEGETPFLNNSLVRAAVKLQSKVVERHVRSAPENVSVMLRRKGIFLEDGWILTRKNGKKYCQKAGEIIAVELREMPLEYAFGIHEHLHYIHAARGNLAFGLFLDGDDIPFSVQAVSKIDRTYKEEALLLAGYNPASCLEFARLFSRPGTPLNTSSFIQSAVRDYLRKKYHQLQAITTSFMPAYASGKSMICSGLNECLLAKSLSHQFFYHDGLPVHKVRRRQVENPVRTTQIPLFPTLELINRIRKPNKTFWKLPNNYMPFYARR